MDTDRPLHEDWKKRVFVGPLPDSFLRINEQNQLQQEAADQQTALALQHEILSKPRLGTLKITISQAKLVKNYGMTRMDPYVRLRVGHSVYETHADSSGGKNPHWNKVIQCVLPSRITQIYVEIYDECSFVMDELIAWGHVNIPPQVIFNEETHEDWYMLSGKQGENQEGMINLVFSYSTKGPYMEGSSSVMMVPSATMFGMPYAPVNVYTAPPVMAAPNAAPRANAEFELKQIAEMFPNIDKEVIRSVYDTNQRKKDATIDSLLQMCE